MPGPLSEQTRERVAPLLALLHWVAGVSYYKTAAPAEVSFQDEGPPPAAAALLQALYSEGLGEFAYTNRLPGSPAAPLPGGAAAAPRPAARGRAGEGARARSGAARTRPSRSRSSAAPASSVSLFSVGDAPPIARTVAAAELPRLLAAAHARPGPGEP